MASKDTDIAGTVVRRGEGIILYLAGANRDPKVFDDPHRFDIERENAGKHLSFSGGRHFCLGAALARAEGEVGPADVLRALSRTHGWPATAADATPACCADGPRSRSRLERRAPL